MTPTNPAGDSAYIRKIDTPIVRDMRMMARELGIVALLLEHQRIYTAHGGRAELYDLVQDALLRLGATNAELLATLEVKP